MNGLPVSARVLLLALVAGSFACGGAGGADPEPGSADAGAVDGGAGGAPDADLPDAGVAEEADASAEPDGAPPVVAVVIDRAFLEGVPDRQLRQGSTATLVVEGRNLSDIRSVHAGPGIGFSVASSDASRRTWRVEVPHGEPVGDATLSLATSAGALELPAAITVTPVVYAADGSADGRGTYGSPLDICRGSDSHLRARRTDTMVLVAGTYQCSQRLFVQPGVIVRGGEGSGRAVLNGAAAGVTVLAGTGATELHDLAVTGTAADVAVLLGAGDVVIDNLEVEGGAIGIRKDGGGSARIARYTYRQPDGTGLRVVDPEAVVEISGATVAPARDGVLALAGQMTISDTRIAVTGDGLVIGDIAGSGDGAAVTMRGGSIEADRAIETFEGSVTVEDSALTAADDTSSSGVRFSIAAVTLRNTTVRGFGSGVVLYTGPAQLRWATVVLDGLIIEAREAGVVSPVAGTLMVRRSRIEASVALTLAGEPRSVDLGTAEVPGENALVGRRYAIDDIRVPVQTLVTAIGTTLNGQSRSGSIVGPVDEPPLYRLSHATELSF